MRNDLVSADKQGDDHGNAQDELERRPEHTHQLDQSLRARNVLQVQLFKKSDLRLFAAKRTHQACA